jgi:hypothetical protein
MKLTPYLQSILDQAAAHLELTKLRWKKEQEEKDALERAAACSLHNNHQGNDVY